jgi:hypothetical protein
MVERKAARALGRFRFERQNIPNGTLLCHVGSDALWVEEAATAEYISISVHQVRQRTSFSDELMY